MRENILEKQLIEIIQNKEMPEHIKLAKVDMLVMLGVDVNTKYNVKSPLFLAKENGLNGVCEYLSKKGAEEFYYEWEEKRLINQLLKESQSENPNIKWVKELIEKGALVNAKNSIGSTALIEASLAGNKELVELLIEKGALVNDKTDSGMTALIWASFKGHKEVAKLLIEAGADIDAKDNEAQQGKTALIWAIQNGHKEVVELLISKGADVNAKNNAGFNALRMAKNVEIANLLIEKGIDIEAKDEILGNTALISASRFGDKELVELLISKGADVNAKDKDGKTALKWAKNEEIRKVIIDAVKKRNEKDNVNLVINEIER